MIVPAALPRGNDEFRTRDLVRKWGVTFNGERDVLDFIERIDELTESYGFQKDKLVHCIPMLLREKAIHCQTPDEPNGQRRDNKRVGTQQQYNPSAIRVGDKRPFAKIELGVRDIHALMDTGATASIISPATWTFVQNNGLFKKYDPTPKQGSTLRSHVVQTTSTAWIVITESGRAYTLPFHIIPSYRNDMLLGVDNLGKMGYQLLLKKPNKPKPKVADPDPDFRP
ncbi:Protein of unknown function [Cotesia congregata]|uniref:Retropepsins domain-containing protein n=1 Tax=Cotesia congregata TaxID=51543 RepID=A0A8J2H8H8_COTCN|nr:Protein of unknown function [Cotesia congregata]